MRMAGTNAADQWCICTLRAFLPFTAIQIIVSTAGNIPLSRNLIRSGGGWMSTGRILNSSQHLGLTAKKPEFIDNLPNCHY